MEEGEHEGLRCMFLLDNYVTQAHSPFAVSGAAAVSVETAAKDEDGAEASCGAALSHGLLFTGRLASGDAASPSICECI